MVKITQIEINGIQNVQTQCESCDLGYYSTKLGERCKQCPTNTYQDEKGKSSCKNCDPQDFSFPGSSHCTPRSRPCTNRDYFSYKTDCDVNFF
jgi:hypothetical protein